MDRKITLPDFLDEQQLKQAETICREEQAPNRRLVNELIAPNLETINQKLGQENDARYLAYVIEFVMRQVGV